MKYLIIISIFLVSCNPCKYVAKHPECFPVDTVEIINDVVHYEKVFITNDSIILDTVPCDPITKTYYDTKTVYQTKTIEKTDTIYQERTTTKLNPINKELQQTKDKLENKLKRHNKVILWLSIALGSVILLILGYIKLK